MESTFLIVGLGNPGQEYARTRHNAGFILADHLAERWRGSWSVEKKFQCRLLRLERGGRRVLLCQPQTFMNASGESVGPLATFFRLPPERVLVMVDDADLPMGQIRLRPSGSSGGHHGLESIEQHLGTRDYPRLRLGIGRTAGSAREITGYVLGSFTGQEQELLQAILRRATEQVECWLTDGIQKAMNQFNGAVQSSMQQRKTE